MDQEINKEKRRLQKEKDELNAEAPKAIAFYSSKKILDEQNKQISFKKDTSLLENNKKVGNSSLLKS